MFFLKNASNVTSDSDFDSGIQEEIAHMFPVFVLEKEMATHSSVLAWRIPGTGEPGGLPSMGSRRIGHD